MIRTLSVLIMLILLSCSSDNQTTNPVAQVTEEPEKLFHELDPSVTGVHFSNPITETRSFNYLRYIYAYNGGGVAIGDIDGDGLEDILFSGNQVPDRLYKNLGNMKFQDISSDAGLMDDKGWSTGVSMVDIDADKDLDIYICRSASLENEELRKNRLYINDGQGHFSEQSAKWGLDCPSFSTQAYYLDHDHDGDIDVYLVNHLLYIDSESDTHWRDKKLEPLFSDRLFENKGTHFEDVSSSSGVLNQCWGLSAAIEDFNQDGYADIYVCNDFREGDVLYINQEDGTFKESLAEHFKHTSTYSMGSDVADINNDHYPDLMVLDMTPASHERSKQNMAAMRTEDFSKTVALGYNNQYMFNMLQINQGNGQFSDISQLAGVSSTDWSWSTLLADYDNDGRKDIIVTNGIKKDVNDRDYKMLIENRFRSGQAMNFDEVLRNWPSKKLSNKSYRNGPESIFEDCTAEWGFNKAQTSHGMAYSDLDNDGDLDVVMNNQDGPASIYENGGTKSGMNVKVTGPAENPNGIGTRITMHTSRGNQSVSIFPSRGFQSSIGYRAHFALDSVSVDYFEVQWPDGLISSFPYSSEETLINFDYALSEKEASSRLGYPAKKYSVNALQPDVTGHQENDFNDYKREVLLPQQMSSLGPCIESVDLNGDGLFDLFIGSSRGFPSKTLLQTQSGFSTANIGLWNAEKSTEDSGALFFDADNDGDQDLMVCSGGNESLLSPGEYPLRFYLNDGLGKLSRSASFPIIDVSGAALTSGDIDNDGDQDVFVGGRQVPGAYGLSPSSFVLLNKGMGVFEISYEHHEDLSHVGMVTDAKFHDMDEDGSLDLVVVGEWMAPTIFYNHDGILNEKVEIPDASGWWYSLEIADMDQDGDQDIVAGNLGLNNKFHPRSEQPMELYAGDLDNNGTHDIVLAKNKKGWTIPVRGRDCSSEQIPSLTNEFPSYKSFSEADLNTIYGYQNLQGATKRSVTELGSCYFENQGAEGFAKHLLPLAAQYGPILSLQLVSMKNDGLLDIITSGGIYDVENETTRYDAGHGCVLFNNGKGTFNVNETYNGFLPYPVKDMILIGKGDKTELISVENRGPARMVIFE